MAYLTLPQVQDIVRRKRRRDMGTPNSPMDIFEGDFSVVDDPYLQGIDQAGLLNMTSVEEVPAFDTNKWGDFTWGGGNNRIRILPEDRVGLDPINRRRGLLTPEQYEDVMAHEVGHSGEQAIGNYATWNPGVENRTHNMLYGHNIAGYFPTEQPSTLQTDAHSGVMSPYMGPGSRSWVDVDPVAAQERLLGVNQKARSMIDQGLLGQDTDSYGTEAFIPAPLRKFGSKAIKHLGGHDHDEPHDEPVAEPTSIKEAQAQGKSYFMKDGKKQLAVTGEQLANFKKSDLYDADSKKSALSQWANIAQSEGGMKKLFKKKPDKQVAAEVKETKADKQFLDDYMQNYYTGKKKDDPEFREDIKARLKGTVPDKHPDGTPGLKKTVANAISSAVKIFGTDKLATGGRMDEATMKKMLQDLGQIESGYRTRIAGGGRPERGFWQVLPSTAKDALTNAGAYFGPTFNKTFAGRDWVKSGQSPYESLKNMSQKDISKLLESDDALGAAFSAVQVLRTFKKKK
tara:strand:- start:854 stop:2392 length:1539 start_codon:yes stop_codon:yes gene_type:complete